MLDLEPAPDPVAAVVVSSHNRAHLLPRLVAALEAQHGAPAFEVVIVDDCSTDNTQEVLEELSAATSLRLTCTRTPTNSGPAAGRNLGWRTATAPLIAFTDDDCVPASDWLGRLVAPLSHVDLVQGQTWPDPERVVSRGPFARMMVVEQPTMYFETCNMAYRRSRLEELGGFDETFTRPFGEDVDLGWRALEAYVTTAWQPSAVVVHDVEHTTPLEDWVRWLKDTRRREFAVLMVKRHAGLRAHMHLRLFYKPSHPLVLLLLATLAPLLARPRRRRLVLAAVGVLPWTVYRAVIQPLPARRRNLWAVLPLNLVGDVAEVGVMVRGSCRHRSILL